jgi:tRNA nucleotidyltransferase (CCA-adding enzyme)
MNLYSHSRISPGTNPHANMPQLLERLPDIAKWLVKEIGSRAAQLNMSAYLVGGPVRDLLLGIPNLDLDFVIEGAAIELAHHLQDKHPDKIQITAEHERFQTTKLSVQNLRVDLSTARTEIYEYPAALPRVEASSLSADLYRRDFTINTLAVCINPDRYGELIDYFDGMHDLEKKTIRILHPSSFIEDPTRIVRAARFAARLSFKLDHDTNKQAQTALATGIFDDLGGVRIGSEIKAVLSTAQRLKALDLLASFSGTLCYLDAHLKYDVSAKRNIRCAERVLARYPLTDDWVVYLAVLLQQLDSSRLEDLLARLQLDNDIRNHIRQGLTLPRKLINLKPKSKASEIYHAVHGASDHSLTIAAALAQPGSFARRAIRTYMEKLKAIQTSLTGADLLKMGLQAGPAMGRALSMLKDGRLDGTLKNRNDEIDFIKANFPAPEIKGT